MIIFYLKDNLVNRKGQTCVGLKVFDTESL